MKFLEKEGYMDATTAVPTIRTSLKGIAGTLFVRFPYLLLLIVSRKQQKTLERLNLLEIGSMGEVSNLDRATARGKGLQPLTSFQRWVFRRYIDDERDRRREKFASAARDLIREVPPQKSSIDD